MRRSAGRGGLGRGAGSAACCGWSPTGGRAARFAIRRPGPCRGPLGTRLRWSQVLQGDLRVVDVGVDACAGAVAGPAVGAGRAELANLGAGGRLGSGLVEPALLVEPGGGVLAEAAEVLGVV